MRRHGVKDLVFSFLRHGVRDPRHRPHREDFPHRGTTQSLWDLKLFQEKMLMDICAADQS